MTTGDELGPASRALLDAARGGLGPDADAIRRMRGKIAIAAGGATAASTGTATAAPSAGTVTSALAIKLGVLGLVVATVAAIGVWIDRRGDHASVAPRLAPPAAEGPRAPMLAVSAETPAVSTETPAASAEAPAPVAATRPVSAPRARPVSAETPIIDLGREVELVDRAMASLRGGDARAALAAVRAHARETAGRGQLAEDATAIEIEALCALGDPAAAAKLEAFDARYPTSAQRARLTTACR